jgi:hypothetical protein
MVRDLHLRMLFDYLAMNIHVHTICGGARPSFLFASAGKIGFALHFVVRPSNLVTSLLFIGHEEAHYEL